MEIPLIGNKALLDSILLHRNYPRLKYYTTLYKKQQISIHHTVSGNGVAGDIAWWIRSLFRIGTAFIIDRNGTIHQLFSSKYYAYHLGVSSQTLFRHGINPDITSQFLNAQSIGIELDSWGGLVRDGEKYYPAKWDAKRHLYVPNYKQEPLVSDQVQVYRSGYRGFKYYEKYTYRQIESLLNLLVYLTSQYNIDRNYNPEMWQLSTKALGGKNGIWSHTSYRKDKSDCHPQPELINMLTQLQTV